MNKNDLQSIGFQELNEEELREVDGGLLYILALNAMSTYIYCCALAGAYDAGYNA